MKKVFKAILILVGILLLILLAGFLYIQTSGLPTYEVKEVSIKIDDAPARVQNGLRLASMMCADCHRGTDGKLSGQQPMDIEPVFGEVWSANLTNHPEFGIREWTNGELAYFIRTGIRKDGRFTPQPWMPKFPHLSDADLNDIIAFLRSSHPLVAASEADHPDPKPSFLNKMLSKMAFKPLPFPEEAIPSPDTTDMIALGEYIVNDRMLCYACHSEAFKTNNELEPGLSPGYLGGGIPMRGEGGEVVSASNLTPHKETGLGNWSLEDFTNSLKWGTRPDGSLIRYPMPKFSALSEKEIEAVWLYLRQVPAIENEVLRETTAD